MGMATQGGQQCGQIYFRPSDTTRRDQSSDCRANRNKTRGYYFAVVALIGDIPNCIDQFATLDEVIAEAQQHSGAWVEHWPTDNRSIVAWKPEDK